MKQNEYKKYMALLLAGMMLATSPAISNSLASAGNDEEEQESVSANSISENGFATADEEWIIEEEEAEADPDELYGEGAEEGEIENMTSVSLNGQITVADQEAAEYEGIFAFDLYDGNGNVIDTATNAADGAFGFNRIFYNEEDAGQVFSYQILERHAGKTIGGIEYPKEGVDVRVYVGFDENNNFTATVGYSGGEQAGFTAEALNDEYESEESIQEEIGYRKDEEKSVGDVIRPITLQVKVTASDSSEALSGAIYELYKGDPNDDIPDTSAKYFSKEDQEYLDQVDESDENGDITFRDLTDGKYYLLEVEAPQGYKLSGSREAAFEVYTDETGMRQVSGNAIKVNEYTVQTALTNEKTEVQIAKVDTNSGDALVGAELEVIDRQSGKQVEKWTSGEESKSIKKLDINKEYVLREVKSANETEEDGNVYAYNESDDTVFTLDEYGNVSVLDGDDAQLTGSSLLNLQSARIPVEKEVITVKEKTVVKDKVITEKGEDKTVTKKVYGKDTVKTVYEDVPSTTKTVERKISGNKATASSETSASVENRVASAVQTGDYTPVVLLIVLILAACGAIAAVVVKKRKH